MKIALIGYGKMGKTIEKLALEDGHQIILKINRTNIDELTIQNLRKADVAIEFSTPQTVVKNILLCFESETPVIIGTTSWNMHQKDIEETCISFGGAMLAASNFSLGVNLFFALNNKLALMMAKYAQYKISLSEIHHTAKLDAPSGTAITLAEGIISQNNQYKSWENNFLTNETTLSIQSIREPDVPGTHVVKYTSNEDSVEIKHSAINRNGFASGALMAAKWLVGKKGVYTMNDVLDIH